MSVKSMHGTTLPIISLLVCKEAFSSRGCSSDSAVKYKKAAELSNLIANIPGQPISNILAGFPHREIIYSFSEEL